jgi:hypothetical protein
MTKDLDAPLWGAQQIGEAANLNERAARYALETGRIAASKSGAQWVTTRRAIMASLNLMLPPQEPPNAIHP